MSEHASPAGRVDRTADPRRGPAAGGVPDRPRCIGRRLGKQAHWIPVLAVFAVWVIAMVVVVNVLTGAAPLLPGSEDSHGYGVTCSPGSRPARSTSMSASSSTR